MLNAVEIQEDDGNLRVPTATGKSWILFVKLPGPGKSWKMDLVLESPGNFSGRSWKVLEFFVRL